MRVPLLLLVLILATDADAARRRAVAATCPPLPDAPRSTPYALRYDQLGYTMNAAKWAVVMGGGEHAPRFRVFDAKTNCYAGEGIAGPRVLDTRSRAGTRLTADRIDLSMLRRAGSYVVVLEDGARFGPVRVGDDVYDDVIPLMLRFLRTQRCGPTDVATSQHGACHLYASVVDGDPDTVSGDGVAVEFGSREFVSSASGRNVDVEGGWHDAGDYLKFVTTSSFVVTMHLFALREHPSLRSDEFLAEVRWGLDWLLKMIDGEEAFVQVGGAGDHGRIRLPEADTFDPLPEYRQRPAVRFRDGFGRNLYGRSAAAFAIGAEVFAHDATYATRLRNAAVRAFARAKSEFRVQTTDPSRWYGEDSADDDLALAAAELYRLTRDVDYRTEAFRYAERITEEDRGLTWNDLGALALSETALAFSQESRERAQLASQLAMIVADVERMFRAPRGPAAAFRYARDEMGHGSIARTLGTAAACLASARLNPGGDCREVARAQLHWLFGQNPFGLSFMIGAGQQWPHEPHHQLWMLSGVDLHGAIVGGPTSSDVLETLPSERDAYARWSTLEVLYEDDDDNYVVNEAAIDTLATVAWLVTALR